MTQVEFKASVQGMLSYINTVNPKQGARLKHPWLNLPIED